ncbi:MAG: nucleoside deaminase [Deinococcota bacterium]
MDDVVTFNAQDEAFMQLALQEAERALAKGNLPIGAVIVHNGEVVATGYNEVDSGKSDLKHAELQAILKVEAYLFDNKRECSIYTTLEPCAMCFGAIVNFHFKRVIFAVADDNVGARPLMIHSAYYQRRSPEMYGGCLEAESQALLNRYFQETGLRPHLAKKL